MALYKEIVTKAVLGKGKKTFRDTYFVEAEKDPSTVLGVWIINHEFKGTTCGETIVLEGSYDVNVWYSYGNDTKTAVITNKEFYKEEVKVRKGENADFDDNTSIIVRSLKVPSCTNVDIKDGGIEYIIEKDLGIEMVGETKIKISVEADEEPWDIIEEEVSTKHVEEIDQIDENFIRE